MILWVSNLGWFSWILLQILAEIPLVYTTVPISFADVYWLGTLVLFHESVILQQTNPFLGS